MMSPRAQTGLLLAIGLVDLISTLIFLRHYDAAEANPLMAAALERGTALFIQAKLALLVGPLALIEWARRRRPVFVNRAMHVCIGAYLVFYTAGIMRVNNPRVDPRASRPVTAADVAAEREAIGAEIIAERKRMLGLRLAASHKGTSKGD